MKKIILYSFMSLFLISSCRKSDNANVPEFTKVPMPTVKKVSGDPTISVQNADAFSAKFTVGLYFSDGDKPAKMDVIVRKNLDNSNTKVFKLDVTTYPTEFTINGVQLRELFGADIVLGDKFDFGVDLTLTNGVKYLAFPTVGVPYGAGVASPAGSSTSTRFEAVCEFKMSDFGAIGSTVNFEVLVDEWADFAVGEVIPGKIIDETHVSFEFPTSKDRNPIIIAINPVDNTTSVKKQTYGAYSNTQLLSVESILNEANFVAPCDLTISVNLKHTVPSGGSYGEFIISLKKK